MKPDIQTPEDIEKMVRRQYAMLLQDQDTSPKFAGLDLENHFPRIIGFWKMVILSQPMAYTGNAFEPHTRLGLTKHHFEKWIGFFEQAVNEFFEGPNAEKAKNHAKLMSMIFQPKLGIR